MTPVDHCWARIGVSGDGTCPELSRVIHCRNCDVYAQAGRSLLEQAPPAEYLRDWATSLAAPLRDDAGETLSIVAFRIGAECLALPTVTFAEAIDMRPVHRVPHRSDAVFLGLVNVRGELQLCVSLAALLSIQDADGQRAGQPRLAVIDKGGQRWVFPVDEFLGAHRIARSLLTPPPVTVSGDDRAASSATFELDGERVALLDAELLFARLGRIFA